MHLCAGIDTDFDDFGKVIFKPALAARGVDLADSEDCPVCRQMRAVDRVHDDPAVPFRVRLILDHLMKAPMLEIGIYPHDNMRPPPSRRC